MTKAEAGMVGFVATTELYFGGCGERHREWLGRYGWFCYVRSMMPWKLQLGGMHYGCHPGPHPAWSAADKQMCLMCACPRRDCICHEVPF
jgi:hypothetical protein